MAIQSSYPMKLQALLHRATIPEYQHLSDATRKKCQAHAESIASIAATVKLGVDALIAAITSATESGSYGDVWTALENVKFDKAALAQELVRLWSDARDLATEVVAELAPIPAELHKRREAVVAEVKDQLTKLGSGLEAQQAYCDNRQAAEKQFDYLARRMNLRSRACNKKL